jgi:hypothetical protein
MLAQLLGTKAFGFSAVVESNVMKREASRRTDGRYLTGLAENYSSLSGLESLRSTTTYVQFRVREKIGGTSC